MLNASGRSYPSMRRNFSLVVLSLLASGLAAASESAEPPSRIDRLEAWMVAIDRHRPGAADPAARMVRSWTLAQLRELQQDLALVLQLVEDPDYPVLWLVDPEWMGPRQRAPYDVAEARRLRTLACYAAWRCRGNAPLPADVGPLCTEAPEWRCETDRSLPTEVVARCTALSADLAARCTRNDVLRRGAVLHTDAVLRVGGDAAPSRPRGADSPYRWTIHFDDGRQNDTTSAAFHTDLARALLDDVAPDPGRDETVRLWHIATSAWGQRHRRYERHEERALELFPDDPQVLLLAGSLHETLASAAIQSMVRAADLPREATPDVGSTAAELERAEELLRRALAADPALTEARVRLGRVLHLRGDLPAAVDLLQEAVEVLSPRRASRDGDRLLYYAEMFLGAATEALGHRDQARAAYARAAELYPRAPSPRLALSRLALAEHDRPGALEAVRALRPPSDDDTRPDPWLDYDVFVGRDVDAWLAALYASVEGRP
jgi:thioredoxin-like negative regulator of GroEL